MLKKCETVFCAILCATSIKVPMDLYLNYRVACPSRESQAPSNVINVYILIRIWKIQLVRPCVL